MMGPRRNTNWVTLSPRSNDLPNSPVPMSRSHLPYWTTNGSRSPRACSRFARCSGVILLAPSRPKMATRGSPGSRRMAMKMIMVTPSRVGIDEQEASGQVRPHPDDSLREAAEKGPSAALSRSGTRCGVPGVRLTRPCACRLASGRFEQPERNGFLRSLREDRGGADAPPPWRNYLSSQTKSHW